MIGSPLQQGVLGGLVEGSVEFWEVILVVDVQLGNVKGQLGVPLTVYPWYLLCSLGIQGFLGIITHKYQLYRAYIGIPHRGTLIGVHPTIP